jgi:hypothetical protein
MRSKTCTGCKLEMPLKYFPAHPTSADRKLAVCTGCYGIQQCLNAKDRARLKMETPKQRWRRLNYQRVLATNRAYKARRAAAAKLAAAPYNPFD